MPKIQRVANHLRYIRSNITVVIISFTFTIGAVLAAQSFVRAGSVLANDYGYDDQAYVDDNRYGCHDDGRYNCSPRPTYTPYPTHPPKPTYSPHPTYTPKPTYTPQPTHHPEPNFICTWMKATISGKTVTLYAQGNVSGGAHIVGYKFDFGDGYVSGSSGPLAHTYSRYATYNTKAWIQYKYYGQLYWTAPCTLIVNVLGSDPHPTYKPHPTYQPKPTYKPHPTYKPQPTHHPHLLRPDCPARHNQLLRHQNLFLAVQLACPYQHTTALTNRYSLRVLPLRNHPWSDKHLRLLTNYCY